jgi:hypothetical protein
LELQASGPEAEQALEHLEDLVRRRFDEANERASAMPFSLHGIGVSRGYAIGRTYLLQRNQPEITEYTIPDAIIEDEVQRFLNSLEICPAAVAAKSGSGFLRRPQSSEVCRLYRHPFADAGRRDLTEAPSI